MRELEHRNVVRFVGTVTVAELLEPTARRDGCRHGPNLAIFRSRPKRTVRYRYVPLHLPISR